MWRARLTTVPPPASITNIVCPSYNSHGNAKKVLVNARLDQGQGKGVYVSGTVKQKEKEIRRHRHTTYLDNVLLLGCVNRGCMGLLNIDLDLEVGTIFKAGINSKLAKSLGDDGIPVGGDAEQEMDDSEIPDFAVELAGREMLLKFLVEAGEVVHVHHVD